MGGAKVGAFADYIVLPEAALNPKPAGLSFGRAAAYGGAYLTAYVALVRRAQLQPGEWVLAHGAAGGVGLAAVDIAKALGARVIATSASDAKLKLVNEEYGPDAILNVSKGFRRLVTGATQASRSRAPSSIPANSSASSAPGRCSAADFPAPSGSRGREVERASWSPRAGARFVLTEPSRR